MRTFRKDSDFIEPKRTDSGDDSDSDGERERISKRWKEIRAHLKRPITAGELSSPGASYLRKAPKESKPWAERMRERTEREPPTFLEQLRNRKKN